MSIHYRQKQTRRMRAEGKSLREIGKAVGAPKNSFQEDLATVRRWLGEE